MDKAKATQVTQSTSPRGGKMTINIPNFHLNSIGPELILTVTAIVILLLDALSPRGKKAYFPQLSLLGLAAAAFQTYLIWGSKGTDFARMIYVDNFTLFFYLVFILGTALTVMISRALSEQYDKNMGEYLRPGALRHRGHDAHGRQRPLIMLFLGLEVMSIAFTSWRACFGRTPAPMRPL